jgi:hypothetical protein
MMQKVLVGKNATKLTDRTGMDLSLEPPAGRAWDGYRRSYPNPRGKELLVRRASTHIMRAPVS